MASPVPHPAAPADPMCTPRPPTRPRFEHASARTLLRCSTSTRSGANPARAGTTRRCRSATSSTRGEPRAGGDDGDSWWPVTWGQPRAGGDDARGMTATSGSRGQPRAGRDDSVLRRPGRAAVRGPPRGGDTSTAAPDAARGGPAPRGRGRPRRPGPDRPGPGASPAWAGTTPARRTLTATARGQTDHHGSISGTPLLRTGDHSVSKVSPSRWPSLPTAGHTSLTAHAAVDARTTLGTYAQLRPSSRCAS